MGLCVSSQGGRGQLGAEEPCLLPPVHAAEGQPSPEAPQLLGRKNCLLRLGTTSLVLSFLALGLQPLRCFSSLCLVVSPRGLED